ncbi:unnamed protein product [Ambrosiozyma monospora]|uniref:Unnamed protein product n=1 Tax=Ambrosiozyma monospora TaxID=43982 RepID=A0ACB5TIL6_AMBMO|nr:unnamed protein product [Ambrosiozyma monospora]
MDHSSGSCNVEERSTSDVAPKEAKKVDWRLTMDYLFPPECLQIPNFLAFLCLVICCNMGFTVSMNAQFQYHQFVDQNSSILSSLKVFPLAIGVISGGITYREKYVIKLGTKWFMIIFALLALGASIWQTRVNFNISKSYFKFEMFSLFFTGFSLNYIFDVFLNSVMASTPMYLQGSVAGIYFTTGQVGVAVGDAIFTSVAGELGIPTSHSEKETLHTNIVNGLYVGVAAAALAFIAALLTIDTDSVQAKAKKAKLSAQSLDSESSIPMDLERQDDAVLSAN